MHGLQLYWPVHPDLCHCRQSEPLTQPLKVKHVQPWHAAWETLANPITSAALDERLMCCINLLNTKQIVSGQRAAQRAAALPWLFKNPSVILSALATGFVTLWLSKFCTWGFNTRTNAWISLQQIWHWGSFLIFKMILMHLNLLQNPLTGVFKTEIYHQLIQDTHTHTYKAKMIQWTVKHIFSFVPICTAVFIFCS